MEDDFLTLDGILKADTKPTDVTLSGQLTPQQARTFIKAIIDRQSILKNVTVDICSKLTKTRTAYDIGKGVLNRHVSGQAVPADAMKKLGVIGCTLDMTKAVSLNARILQETINDNKDNPDFEKEQFEGFSIAFTNDLDYLGIAGTADNPAANAPFAELAKGWVTVAKESATVKKVTTTKTTVVEQLKVVVQNLHEDVKGGKAEINLSAIDYDAYQLEVSEAHPNSGAIINGGINTFLGYKLNPNSNMEAGEYLATIPKNMVFGIATQIERNRWYDNEASALRYKFVVYCDYEFDIHKYVTFVEYVA
ncbi:MAG: phage capsid protein [Candidatus Paceibacteria bacterium]